MDRYTADLFLEVRTSMSYISPSSTSKGSTRRFDLTTRVQTRSHNQQLVDCVQQLLLLHKLLTATSNFSAASLLFFIGFYNRYDDVTVAATIFFNRYDDVTVVESRFLSISNADVIVAARSFFLLGTHGGLDQGSKVARWSSDPDHAVEVESGASCRMAGASTFSDPFSLVSPRFESRSVRLGPAGPGGGPVGRVLAMVAGAGRVIAKTSRWSRRRAHEEGRAV
ncbi:curculin-like lectin family protein [Dorcoceras hygrometricum]|uniref:Curculin-like lectin family protein n=1 Tax=Dorcoceras hygrometricum TaxID=472368 RepID=A0A2Z7D283_9LAMI|nr:curculin-like lectin family protein [Dorcoceras hygrometricum]